MRRLTLIAVVALVLAGLVWWAAHVREGGPQVVDAQPTSQSAVAQEEPTPTLGPVAVDAVRAQAPDPARVAASESAARAPTLHGTVVVVGARGGESRCESGTLELTFWKNGKGEKLVVAVENGKFEASSLAPGARFYPLRAHFSDRDAAGTGRDPITIPADGCVEIRLRWRLTCVVRVRDARTGRDLSKIEIDVRYATRTTKPELPPSNHTFPLGTFTGDSPWTMPADQFEGLTNANVLFARAEGYAWGSVPFDAKLGGEVFVELAPSCGLDVEIRPAEHAGGGVVTLVREGETDPTYTTTIRERSRIAIDDVPPGTFAVAAILPPRDSNQELRVSKRVDLVPGDRPQVTLELGAIEAVPERERARLSGELLVPVAWNSTYPRLTAIGVEGAAEPGGWPPNVQLGSPMRSGSIDTYSFEFTSLRVGTYVLRSTDPICWFDVDVPPGGATGLRLQLPEPADLGVRVVDAATGDDVDVQRLRWTMVRGSALAKESYASVKRTAGTSAYDVRCPMGTIELSVTALDLGYEPLVQQIQAVPGPNAVVLRMRRAPSVRVVLYDGEDQLLGDKGQRFDCTEVDGDGRAVEWSAANQGACVGRVSKAGNYLLRLREPIAGYLMPPDQIVAVRSGLVTDVAIRLTRKP